jgi:hypothetical protein
MLSFDLRYDYENFRYEWRALLIKRIKRVQHCILGTQAKLRWLSLEQQTVRLQGEHNDASVSFA